ncbi:MAG: copper resistance protein B [Gammaproteobacteria bacterium]|nr:MAG: copper resistance protein B [Gammaproteobacteria bacterium]
MNSFFCKKTYRKLPRSLFSVALFYAVTLSHAAQAHEHDDPVIARVMLDELEVRNGDGENPTSLEAQAWVGKDLNKLWLKADVETHDGKAEESELQVLYSHAIAPYWDLQTGMRQDIKPTPSRTWGVLGVQGLAPYFFEIDAAFFIGEAGRTAARFSVEYDLLITQRLILSPSLEVNFYGQNDIETGTGSGLSDANAGLRLRYEIYREFAPYIGINWEKNFGATADFSKVTGESDGETEWVLGLRAWF